MEISHCLLADIQPHLRTTKMTGYPGNGHRRGPIRGVVGTSSAVLLREGGGGRERERESKLHSSCLLCWFRFPLIPVTFLCRPVSHIDDADGKRPPLLMPTLRQRFNEVASFLFSATLHSLTLSHSLLSMSLWSLQQAFSLSLSLSDLAMASRTDAVPVTRVVRALCFPRFC